MGENLSPGASSIKPLLLSSPQTPPGALPTSTLCLSLSFSPSPSHMFHASSFSFLVPCTRVHTGLRQTQCGLPQAPSRFSQNLKGFQRTSPHLFFPIMRHTADSSVHPSFGACKVPLRNLLGPVFGCRTGFQRSSCVCGRVRLQS